MPVPLRPTPGRRPQRVTIRWSPAFRRFLHFASVRRPAKAGTPTLAAGAQAAGDWLIFSAALIVALRGRAKAEKCACPLAAHARATSPKGNHTLESRFQAVSSFRFLSEDRPKPGLQRLRPAARPPGMAHFSAALIVALRGRDKAEKCACPLAAHARATSPKGNHRLESRLQAVSSFRLSEDRLKPGF